MAKNRLVSIDALRGVGALAVVMYHVTHHQAQPLGPRYLITLPLDFGYLGVTLFIVISGFCIHLNAAREIAKGKDIAIKWGAFWKRRFIRLYPPYLVAIAVGLPFALGAGTYDIHQHLAADILTHLSMIHNLFPVFIFGLGNPALWSLGLEEQLYGLYAFFQKVRVAKSLALAVSISFFTSIVWLASFAGQIRGEHGGLSWWVAWPFTYWAGWVLGAVAAEVYAGSIDLPTVFKSRVFAILCFGVGALCSPPFLGIVINLNSVTRLNNAPWIRSAGNTLIDFSYLIFSIGFFVIINWITSRESRQAFHSRTISALATVGLFSYSIYLVHQPIVFFIESKMFTADSFLNIALRYLVILPACLGFGSLFYLLVERRFLNRNRRSILADGATQTASAKAGRI